MFRIVHVLISTVVAIVSIPMASGGPPAVSIDAPEHQAMVADALNRFDAAGLQLPSELHIEFAVDRAACRDYGGLYFPSTVEVRICRPSERTLVHELAHAWVETTLTEAQREAFLDLRGLHTWAGGTEWDGRGAEHAAEIVMWALLDEDPSVRWIDTVDGVSTRTTKLFKIPNSSYDELVEAYRQLTGADPVLRLAQGPLVLDEPSPATRGGF